MIFEMMETTWCRFADLDAMLRQHLSIVGPRSIQITHEFIKNDPEARLGMMKTVIVRNASVYINHIATKRPHDKLFETEYNEVVKEMTRILGVGFGRTRAIRRMQASRAVVQGANPELIKTMLAHRNLYQQRVYTGMQDPRQAAAQIKLSTRLHTSLSDTILCKRRRMPCVEMLRMNVMKKKLNATKAPRLSKAQRQWLAEQETLRQHLEMYTRAAQAAEPREPEY